MTRLGAWVQASRPLAQIPVASALVYGQSLAFSATGHFDAKVAALVALLGVAVHLLVVFANEAVDSAVDSSAGTWSRFGGSSRVVPEGKLAPMELAKGALGALLLLGAIAGTVALTERRALMLVIAAIVAHLTWMYGFAPFRLAARGFGEIAQGFGLGVLLPGAGYYAQANGFEGLHPATLFPAFLLGYASHVIVGLPDTAADRAGAKRTYSARRGERQARLVGVVLVALAALSTPLAAPGTGAAAWVVGALAPLLVLVRAFPLVGGAESTDRVKCERFVLVLLAATQVVVLGWAGLLLATAA
jgi:1,4-dihydroxy-2-naphthoate octaprenyltransferase